MSKYDTWLKVGNTFRCGCCEKIPTFVDINDLAVCPHCKHVMKGYETDHGIFLFVKNGGEGQNDKEKMHE